MDVLYEILHTKAFDLIYCKKVDEVSNYVHVIKQSVTRLSQVPCRCVTWFSVIWDELKTVQMFPFKFCIGMFWNSVSWRVFSSFHDILFRRVQKYTMNFSCLSKTYVSLLFICTL